MKIGEEKDITTTFPAEYHSAELAGKETIFKIKLHEIKRKELPALDDEFAKDISEFDTFEEYKKSVMERLEKSKKGAAKAERENKVIEKLAEKVEANIPDSMVELEIDNMVKNFEQNLAYQGLSLEQYMQMLNMDMESLRAQFKDNALKDIKVRLALESVAKQENIEVTAEEIDTRLDELSAQYGDGSADSLKSNHNARHYIEDRIKEEKLLEVLVSNAVEK